MIGTVVQFCPDNITIEVAFHQEAFGTECLFPIIVIFTGYQQVTVLCFRRNTHVKMCRVFANGYFAGGIYAVAETKRPVERRNVNACPGRFIAG